MVEAYNMILENTVTDEDFEQYRPALEASMNSRHGPSERSAEISRNAAATESRSMSHSESQPLGIKPMWQRMEEQK